MEFLVNAKGARVEVRLKDDVEEASFAYDLVASKRLLLDDPNMLPLPFRGQFLFKVPEHARPLALVISRMEASAEEQLAGGPGLTLLVGVPGATEEVLQQIERAMREVPPASAEEFKVDLNDRMDEFSKIRALNHAQRVILATRAGQTQRQILMQQPNPLILLYLCKNPLITLPEIIQIAKMPSIDALVAEYITKLLRSNPQYGMNEELKMALAQNPKTPGGTALSLLRGLNSRNLRDLCKRGEVRQTIKQAAIRMLGERRD
jgi:hypothetical protein